MTDRKEKNNARDDKTNRAPSTSGIAAAATLDIIAEVCPMTFVRTRLALDRLPVGGLLLVRLRGPEPRRSVPENAASLGHEVVSVADVANGVTEVLLRRG